MRGRLGGAPTPPTREARPPEPGPQAARSWTALAGVTAALFGVLAPFTIQAQIAFFLALALCFARPRAALAPLLASRPLAAAWLFYFLVQGVSIAYSQDAWRSLRCLRGDWPVLFFPVFLGILQIRSARRIGLTALLISAALAGLYGVFQHFSGIDLFRDRALEPDVAGRFLAVGNASNHLTYGGIMLVAFAASAGLFVAVPFGRRAIWLATTLGSAAGLLSSYARSAWLGAAAAVATLAISIVVSRSARATARGYLRSLGPLVAIAGAAVLLLVSTTGMRERVLALGRHAGFRLGLWGTALRFFMTYPITGAGLGEWKKLFNMYKLPQEYRATGHPHNDLLNAVVHSGLLGAVAFIALWLAIILSLRPGVEDRAARTDGAARVVGLAVVAAFLAGGLSQCYFTDQEPAGMVWFVLAALVLEARGAPSGTQRPA